MATGPSTISSGYVLILAPKPPPTSGVMIRTWPASMPLAATIGSLTPWACWVEIHWVSRPSVHAAAELRTSSGQGATRWLMNVPETVTSQSAKYSSPVRSGMPSAVESNTALLPAAS